MIVYINTAVEDFEICYLKDKKVKSFNLSNNRQAEEIDIIFREHIISHLTSKSVLIVNNGPGYLTGLRVGCSFAAGVRDMFESIYTCTSFDLYFMGQACPVAIKLRKNYYAFKEIESTIKDYQMLSTDEILDIAKDGHLVTNCEQLAMNQNIEKYKLTGENVLPQVDFDILKKCDFIHPFY